jgi:hypothetical protein
MTIATAQSQARIAARDSLMGQLEDLIIDGAMPDAPEVVALDSQLSALNADAAQVHAQSMTDPEKVKAISRFVDATAVGATQTDDLAFSLEWGSNEGCYMNLGKTFYRVQLEGPEAQLLYRNAVVFYLTLF